MVKGNEGNLFEKQNSGVTDQIVFRSLDHVTHFCIVLHLCSFTAIPYLLCQAVGPQGLTQGSLTLGILTGSTKGKSQQEFGTETGQGIYVLVLSPSQCLSCSGKPAPAQPQFCQMVSISQPQLSPAFFSSPCPSGPMSGNGFPLLPLPGSFSITSAPPPTSSLESIKFYVKSQVSVLFQGPVR